MAQRRALGRGLSALIPPAEAGAARRKSSSEQGDGPLFVPLDRIVPNPRQPRKHFREEEIESLAISIREQGVLQPLVVRRRDGGYELIIGERRWRAAQRAGLKEVPAVVLDATDRGVLEMALVENVQRADLNPIELSQAFRVLVEDEGLTQEEAGRRVGLDRSTVANHLRLLELPAQIRQDLIDGRLSMGHAKAILGVPPDQRVTVRDRILRAGLSVRLTEEFCRRIASSPGVVGKRGRRPGPTRDVHVVDLEERLKRSLRTKVRLVGRRDRGRIELHFHGAEELDRLTDFLLGGEV
jgi:ParB family chromosome partitioning protein